MTQKRMTSVMELARLTSDNVESVKQLEATIRRRQIVKKLMAIRAAKGLSQKGVADLMGVSQSKISKLEGSYDDAISLGDLREYLRALNLDLCMIACPQEWSATEQIKFHVSQIRGCLSRLVQVAHNTTDAAVRAGIQQFHVEALVNMLVPVLKSAESLPKVSVGAPEIVDAMNDTACDDTSFDDAAFSVHPVASAC